MIDPDLGGVDQSWSRLNPILARQVLGPNGVIADYLSWDDSKDWTSEQLLAYHAVGLGGLFNFESQPGRPLLGHSAGVADANRACDLLDAIERHVPYRAASTLKIPFSCDVDVNLADGDQRVNLFGYYRGTLTVCHDRGRGNGAYGEADLIDALAEAGLIDMAWQTYAWSYSRLSKHADFYQYRNGQLLGGASVDFNRVIRPERMGVWWPPGHRFNVADGKPAAPVKPALPRGSRMFELFGIKGRPGVYYAAPGEFHMLQNTTQTAEAMKMRGCLNTQPGASHKVTAVDNLDQLQRVEFIHTGRVTVGVKAARR